jgi:hypothetical protein
MKIQNAEINGYIMFGEWTETDWHIWLWNCNEENEANDDPSKDL